MWSIDSKYSPSWMPLLYSVSPFAAQNGLLCMQFHVAVCGFGMFDVALGHIFSEVHSLPSSR